MESRRCLGALLLAAALPLFAYAAPADDLKGLLDQGKAAEAYALGKKNPDQLGNPAFDFYFGIAAVDAGHAGEGVLALERYIANFPDNMQARLELARAYFVLGDNARAREEFDLVQKSNPPAPVQANIERFKDAIRARESAYQTTAGFYAEIGAGYDSNVSGGVGSPNITLPVFGPVTLTSGVKTADSFGWLAAGGNVTYPVAPGLALFGAANADAKANRSDTPFDQTNVNIAGGGSLIRQNNLYRLTASWGELGVGHDWYRTMAALTGEVNHQLDELQSVNAALQYAKLNYQAPNDARNADLSAGSLGYRRALISSWQPLLSLSVNYGQEHNVRARPDLGRQFWGGRAAVAMTPVPRWGLSLGASYQDSEYDGVDPLLGVVRKDKFWGLDAALSYALTRNWSVRGEYQFLKNDSNLALYEFDRQIVAVKLRYEFK